MLIKGPELLSADDWQADICIVGAGAAGLTLACELDGSGLRVLLLDAGDLASLSGISPDYAGHAEPPHPDPTEFRRVGFGGTTVAWGGRCVPYDPIDFERRAHVAESGWPIGYEDVAQHYARAMQYCDAGANEFGAAEALPGALPTLPGFDAAPPELLLDRLERYSLPTHFGLRYRERISASSNVLAVLDARCVRLVRAAGEDRIEAVEVVRKDGGRHLARAARVVLAMGGIEIPRLLLASDPEGPGLGNRYDHVGRWYTCHFENLCARLSVGTAAVPFEFEKSRDGVYCRRKLQFSAAAQREHRLLNTAFRLHFPNYADASHGSAVLSTIYLVKSLLIPEYQKLLQGGAGEVVNSPRAEHLRNLLTGLPQLARFAFEWLFLNKLATRKLPYTLIRNADGSFPLEFNAEQTPLFDSRVRLGDETDRHGLRRVDIRWRLAPDDVDAAFRAFTLLQQIINRNPLCRMDFDADRLRGLLARSIPVGGHHIGTARMAASATNGVVDADCAVFGLPNLYLASSATFPTSGHANPTLTIVAMAIRLAAHLRAG